MDPAARQDAAKAQQLLRAGQFAAAIPLYERAIKRAPRDASLLHQLATAQAQCADQKAAIRTLQKAITLKPDASLYLADLAQLYMADGRFDDAERTIDRALRVDPDMAFAMGAKIELLQFVGRFDEARTLAETAIAAHPGDVRLGVAYAKLAPRIGAEARAIDILDDLLVETSAPRALKPEARAFVLFRLADLLDRTAQYDRAFAAAAEANALTPARYDPAVHAISIDRLIAAWTPDAIAAMPRATRTTDQPIFIVGMLRSGTSLVEQILSCHPDVFAGDELNTIGAICARLRGPYPTHEPRLVDPSVLTTANLDQAQREYLAALYTLGARPPRTPRATDKMPGNFAHLGLIARMLPGARVIHCTRDPLDTALSCFFHHFHGSHPWCYRLDWIGAYYNDYARLMDHWKRVLPPDPPILDVPYESLVADPDTWIPRIVAFAGLEWNDACLRFHESRRISQTVSNEQVRRPMYQSSVGRHQHYAAHLGPLRKALGLPD